MNNAPFEQNSPNVVFSASHNTCRWQQVPIKAFTNIRNKKPFVKGLAKIFLKKFVGTLPRTSCPCVSNPKDVLRMFLQPKSEIFLLFARDLRLAQNFFQEINANITPMRIWKFDIEIIPIGDRLL